MKLYKHIYSLIVIISVISFCSSCTSDKSKRELAALEDIQKIPEEVNYPVKIIPQNDNYSCGTTSVAMAISYFENPTINTINKDYVWKISGSSIDIARKKGFELKGFENIVTEYNYKYDFYENITFDELEYLLANNALVVIFIRMDKQSIHAVLVKGYNRKEQIFYVNDPSEYIQTLTYEFLNTNWNAEFADLHKRTNRSGFVIYPKSN